MNIRKYIQLVEQLIESEKLTQEEKQKYLKLLEMIEKISNLNLEQYEKESYYFKGKYLSEKERIIYELNRLSKCNDSKSNQLTIKKLAYQLSKSKSKNNYADLKKKITKIQLNNNITPSFYSQFESFIEDELKPSVQDETIKDYEVVKNNK